MDVKQIIMFEKVNTVKSTGSMNELLYSTSAQYSLIQTQSLIEHDQIEMTFASDFKYIV